MPGGAVPARESAPCWLQDLDPVEATLLVPLMARAWGRRWHLDAAQPDASAERVLAQLKWDGLSWVPDPVTLSLIVWRTRQLCEWGRAHFERHPRAWGLNVGAGLSDYFQWLDTGANRWLDADLACVMRLRAQCLPTRTHAETLTVDLRDKAWWSQVQARVTPTSAPLWIMLEGVLIYLTPDDVQQLLNTLGEYAPAGSSLAFDVIPRWMVGWPVRGPMGVQPPAQFQWGINRLEELQAAHDRLHVEQVVSSPMPGLGWPWKGLTDWNVCSPYSLVRMSVS